ncbi:CYTH domain-containing protein [Aureisphaera galaxeae]|uniref:CYTH domain-containing protein n=1 Tax=Aureisphaera galaxeae TaxID=1538023 RepID=UPI002350D9AB|nr:CYTH domain-containing protein [Aureisphaera galaxeae]MDC8005255.1 CYTH domain-containing protein [Aureisphaera galaxeae]
MIEIERKFLVNSEEYKKETYSQTRIVQGFLNTHPERTVRIRIKGDKAFLTVKGISNEAGTSRFEWEREISVKEAETLIPLCEEGIIEKVRYEVQVKNHIFEIDEFLGNNVGLVVAEVELNEEDETFLHPGWLGKEVTGDIRYYNSQLSKQPYTQWKNKD